MGVLENKARARLFYKYLSKVYDRVNPFIWNEEMRDEALEMLDIQQGDRVLDVGCGTGFGTEGLLRYTDDVHGLDQSIHQMQKAWEKFGKNDEVRFYRGDAERLPFADDSFDVIWSSGSIEYWPNPVTALEEFRRVVKPGEQGARRRSRRPEIRRLPEVWRTPSCCSTTRRKPTGCSRPPASSTSNTTSSSASRAARGPS